MRSRDPDKCTEAGALILQEHATRLETAIATLPAPLRETLVLREVHELSYREIAEGFHTRQRQIEARNKRTRRRVFAC